MSNNKLWNSSVGSPRKLAIAIPLLLSFASPAFAAPPDFEWLEQFGSSGSANESIQAAASDGSGNILVTGFTTGTLSSADGFPLTNAGNQDAFLRKYDPTGAELWTVEFGTASPELAFAIAVDNTGIYVAGGTAGVLGGAPAGTINRGFNDAFVVKYSNPPTGRPTLLWIDQFGGSGTDNLRGVAVRGTDLYVVGITNSGLPFREGGKGTGTQGTGGTPDAFIRRYHAGTGQTGTYASTGTVGLNEAPTGTPDESQGWTRQFGNASVAEQALAVAAPGSSADSSGGVYVAGQTNSALENTPPNVLTNTDAYLRKYDAAGNVAWTARYAPTNAFDGATAVAADGSGVYVAGMQGGNFTAAANAFVQKYGFGGGAAAWTTTASISTAVGDQAFALAADGAASVYVAGRTQGVLYAVSSAGGDDAFLAKLDRASGALTWGLQTGSANADQANGLLVNAAGVGLVGQTTGSLPSTVLVGSIGAADAFIQQYLSAGATPTSPPAGPTWGSQFGSLGPGQDFVNAVASGTGGVFVAGQIGTALSSQTSSGGADAFARKYSAGGVASWTSQFGTSGDDSATAIALDSSGNVYVTGFVNGLLSGALGDNGSVLAARAGGADAFLRKYGPAGNAIWTHQFGQSGNDSALAVAVDEAGGVYTGGIVDGVLNGALGDDGNPLAAALGGGDAFLRKWDSDGNVIWTHQFGTSAPDQVLGISAYGTAAYVAGIRNGLGTDLSSEAFLRKHDAAGVLQWDRSFGTAGADAANAVVAGAAGVFVVGDVDGSFPLQDVPGDTTLGGQFDIFVRMYDHDGSTGVYTATTSDETAGWTRRLGNTPSPVIDRGLAVTVDGAGVLVAGFSSGQEFPGQPNAGQQDALVRKYSFDGSELWTRLFGSTLSDNARGISSGPSGLVVGGFVADHLPGLTSAGLNDAFIGAFDTTPPAILAASASPEVLWPPDHRMVPVVLEVDAEDTADPAPACEIASVTSDEPIDGPGGAEPDWEVTGPLSLNLRAERSGAGSGRTYTITVRCTDASGNSATNAVTVTVPHDQRGQ